MTEKKFFNEKLSPEYIAKNKYTARIEYITAEEMAKPESERTVIVFNAGELERGSLKLTQSINAEPYFIYGGGVASSLSFTVISSNAKQSPSGQVRLVIYTHDANGMPEMANNSGRLELFTGNIQEAEPTKAGGWKVTAYDAFYTMRNATVSTGIKNLVKANKAAGLRTTWGDVLRALDDMIPSIGHGYTVFEWFDSFYFPDNDIDNLDSIKCIDLLKEFAFFSKMFAVINGEGTLKFIGSPDSYTTSTAYVIDVFSDEDLEYKRGKIWEPRLFISNPSTNLFYTNDSATVEEMAEKNIYTITNSTLLGDKEWIEALYGCDEYGNPNSAYSPTSTPHGLFDVSKMMDLPAANHFIQQEYSLNAYMDPTIPLGAVLIIRKNGDEVVRSFIVNRTVTFETTQTIKCELEAKNNPYNTEISEKELDIMQAKKLANTTATRLPSVSTKAGINKLRTIKAISKAEYDKLTEKRADTIYYVYDDG